MVEDGERWMGRGGWKRGRWGRSGWGRGGWRRGGWGEVDGERWMEERWMGDSLVGQTLSASGRGSGDIPIVELCRHARIKWLTVGLCLLFPVFLI